MSIALSPRILPVGALLVMGSLLFPHTAEAHCLDPLGDITQNGVTDISDVQCESLTALWELSDGDFANVPACTGESVLNTDPNCDGTHDVIDLLLVINYVLGIPLSSELDADGNGCPDTCDVVTCLLGDCDDGIACTMDGCDASGACFSYPSDSACDDGDDCTVATCDEIADCQVLFKDNGVACDDNDLCTHEDACASGACTGVFSAICDDGNICTTNDACAAGKCTGDVAGDEVCNDDNSCTIDFCNALGTGCLHGVEPAGTSCNDGDPCTANEQCNGTGMCQWSEFSTDEGCELPVLCSLDGAVGDILDCPLQIARASFDSASAAAAQLKFKYPNAHLSFISIFDELCFGPSCFEFDILGGPIKQLSSGHTISCEHTDPTAWDPGGFSNNLNQQTLPGEGLCAFVHTSSPFTALSNAFVDISGAIEGNPEVLQARFKLLVPGGASVHATSFTATLGTGVEMDVSWDDGIMIVQ